MTILPRTNATLGFAQYTPRDKNLYSPEEMMDRMCMALGGRVAESITFNKVGVVIRRVTLLMSQVTTGAQNDLEKVTKMAFAQIKQFGFSDTIGHLSFEDNGGVKPYSKKLQSTMDLEARQMIADAYKLTEKVLMENKDKLEVLAQLLLERETLNYSDVEAILGPPPHGDKVLVSPLVRKLNHDHDPDHSQDYEAGLRQQSKLAEEGQGMGSGTH